MKAGVLSDAGRFEIIHCAPPQIERPGEVLLRVDAVGVCGSDIHYFTEGRIGDQVVRYPYRIGHEFSGTVVAVGESVRHPAPGDRVAVDPAISCGSCDQCVGGRPHTCRKLVFLGCPGQVEGCLAEFIVMPAECCFPVPRSMSSEEAALVEPISIGVYAATLAGSLLDARVGILGCGPIGLSVLTSSLGRGVARAYVTDPLGYRRQFARSMGADWAEDPFREGVIDELKELEPALLDVVFECCGKQEAIDQGVRMLKPGGRLVLVGIPAVDRISFDMDDLRRKELSVQNVRRQNGCMFEAIRQVEANPQLGSMVTHRFRLDEVQSAFETVAGYRDDVVKAVIMMAAS